MKLQNKKTDRIGNLVPTKEMKTFRFVDDEWNIIAEYNTLAELNEEWEDYEEPEEVWYIDFQGMVRSASKEENDWFKENEIGNCFETKEEAEKTVEKLKAWKRLKKLGFRFIGETCEYKDEKHFGSVFFKTSGDVLDIVLDIYEDACEFYDDLDLIFGGEE